jgi:hypothetical protein
VTRLLRAACLLGALVPVTAMAQLHPVSVTPDSSGAALITFAHRRVTHVPKERGQTGISDALMASDGRSAGWLVDYHVDGVSDGVAETLVIWRDGKVIRRFRTEQAFYSWAFHSKGAQVAFHTGPLHGEHASYCELHDVKTGRRLAVWNGNLESANKPTWVAGLYH